jgi:hypothetical protein
VLLLSPLEPLVNAAGRRGDMVEADKQDYEVMEEIVGLCRDPVEQELDGMCYEAALSLQKLHDKLPTVDQEMQDSPSSYERQYLPSVRGFNHLLSAMANMEQKLTVRKLVQ